MSEVPAGWRRTTLGEVAAWGSGGTPAASNPRFYGGDVPWVIIGDLKDGLVTQTRRSLTAEGVKASSAKLVPVGAVLLAMYGSIGKLGIAGRTMATNQAIAFAVPQEKVSSGFLFQYLMHQRPRLMDAGKGATQKNISQTLIKSWSIDLPSLREQQRIVDVLEDHLSRLDAADAYLSAAKRRSDAYREQVVMGQLLGTGRPASGPVDVEPAGTADGSLSPLPDGWSWRRLGDLATVVGGVTKDAKKQSDPVMVEVPYLRVANVQRGRLDLSSVSRIRVSPEKAEVLRLLPGDVLMNEGGDRDKLARGWVWNSEVADCIHQNHVFRARVINEAIEPVLLSLAANSIGADWASRNGTQSVNLASISLRKIKLMPVPVPPREQQRQMVDSILEAVATTEQVAAAIAAQHKRSSALRRALLSAAFSGRLTGASTDTEVVEEIADSQGAS